MIYFDECFSNGLVQPPTRMLHVQLQENMDVSFGKVGTVKNPPIFRQTTTPISSTVGFGLKEKLTSQLH